MDINYDTMNVQNGRTVNSEDSVRSASDGFLSMDRGRSTAYVLILCVWKEAFVLCSGIALDIVSLPVAIFSETAAEDFVRIGASR
jgi:hypothetical protein